ncbi:MAG: DUF4236 domain-containing protein [Clostridia bacterium]|nr:DUF4236 domain-containing protein [Clostridia bacterium]
MRFRKSIRLCKGVKLNLSKSGVSLSTGIRGLSLTTSKKGMWLNTSLPGTGIYDRKQIVNFNKKKGTKKSAKTAETAAAKKQSRAALPAVDMEKARAEADNFNRMIIAVENIHLLPLPGENTAAPQAKPAANERPTMDSVKEALRKEAEGMFRPTLWSFKSKVENYIAENIDARYEEAMAEWEDREMVNAVREDNALNNADGGDIDDFLANAELPVECDAQYEFDPATNALYLDIDLPEIEDMPDEQAEVMENGEVKITKRTQNEIREGYVSCILGIGVYFAAGIYRLSDEIEDIIVSGYTQRRDSEGDIEDVYVYSVHFTRPEFEGVGHTKMPPYDFCMGFENRINATSTMLLKQIKPFDMEP